MCKYCERRNAIWFKDSHVDDEGVFGKTYEKKLAYIEDMESEDFFKNKSYLEINVDYEENDKNKRIYGKWFCAEINYCPMCGRNLKRKTLSNTIKAIIQYKWDYIHRKELEKNIAKCSECGKKLNEKSEYAWQGKKIYCGKCFWKEDRTDNEGKCEAVFNCVPDSEEENK